MKELSELELAEFRHEMRQVYRDLGYAGSLQVMYEFLKAAEILSEVMIEERQKGN